MTARAAFAAIRAGLTAVFAVADDRDVRHINARRRLRVFLLHRTRILVLFAARAAHRAFAVLAAVSHAAARIFMFGLGCAVLLVHRAMRRRRLSMILRLIDCENDRRQSENQQRRQRRQNSFSHCFSFQNLKIKPRIYRKPGRLRRENTRHAFF
jgi:hypothetical protein